VVAQRLPHRVGRGRGWVDLHFGFAYGTLPGHVERGEERFLVEWDQGDDAVWYDILAFSRPNHLLTRLGYPVVRRLQKRFGRDSAATVLKAVRLDKHVGDRRTVLGELN
jgi:uncharacterized protein (UPF0548 family)